MGQYIWHKLWWKEVLIALDRFVAATLLGAWSDETCSSYAWRIEQQGSRFGKILRPVIDTIMFTQPQHCFHAYMFERMRDAYPPLER